MDITSRRAMLRQLLDVAVGSVDPENLTSQALETRTEQNVTLIAIGKASAAMCRGAAKSLDHPTGVCVSLTRDEVPEGIELIVGDHPIPGEGSFRAGRRVLEVADRAPGMIIALVSGGGSALCEHPIAGVSREFIREVNEVLLSSGASIAHTNLVRRHLSAIKGGGLAVTARDAIDTYLLSDVCGADPSVIASGPTIPIPPDPDAAISTMIDYGIDVPPSVTEAMRRVPQMTGRVGAVQVLADGHTAAAALAEGARSNGIPASVLDGWLQGSLTTALEEFMMQSGSGLTIAAGEPEVAVHGKGKGGRNTHAALLAASHLTGDQVFAAFATDGVDGNSASAGAIVDGGTVSRGGDPRPALERYDSASYLRATGDLLESGPTGTNVSDLWVLWR